MIIGLSGKIGCGKSTVAHQLAQFLSIPVQSFGYAVKEETSDYFGFQIAHTFTQTGKLKLIDTPRVMEHFGRPMQVRELLQWYGTDFRRAENPNYWTDKLLDCGNCIIDDVRFPNEAHFVLEHGYLFRIEHFEECSCDHESECALDNWKAWSSKPYRPAKGKLPYVTLDILNYLGFAGKL